MASSNRQDVSRFGWRQALGGAIESCVSCVLVVITTSVMFISSNEAQLPLMGLAFIAALYTASSFLRACGGMLLVALLTYTWHFFEDSELLRLTCRQLLVRSSAGDCLSTGPISKLLKSASTEGPQTCSSPDSGLSRSSLVQHPSPPAAGDEQMSQAGATCGPETNHLQDIEPATAVKDLALLPAVNLTCKVQPTAPAESPMTEPASPEGPSTPPRLSEASCTAAPVRPASSKPAVDTLPAGIGTMCVRVANGGSKTVAPAPGNGSVNSGAMSAFTEASGPAQHEMVVKHLGKSSKAADSLAEFRPQLVQVSADIDSLKVECLDGVASFVEQIDGLLAGIESDGEAMPKFGLWQRDKYGLIRKVAAVRSHIQCLTERTKAWVAPSYQATPCQLSGLSSSLKTQFDAVESAVTAISSHVTELVCCSKEANLPWDIVYTEELTNAAKLATFKMAVCEVRERCLKICGQV